MGFDSYIKNNRYHAHNQLVMVKRSVDNKYTDMPGTYSHTADNLVLNESLSGIKDWGLRGGAGGLALGGLYGAIRDPGRDEKGKKRSRMSSILRGAGWGGALGGLGGAAAGGTLRGLQANKHLSNMDAISDSAYLTTGLTEKPLSLSESMFRNDENRFGSKGVKTQEFLDSQGFITGLPEKPWWHLGLSLKDREHPNTPDPHRYDYDAISRAGKGDFFNGLRRINATPYQELTNDNSGSRSIPWKTALGFGDN